MRVVLFYHYLVYLWDAILNITLFNESCAILSLHGLFMRVVLFYITPCYESCAILSLPWFIWTAELCYKPCNGRIITMVYVRVVHVLSNKPVYLWELCYSTNKHGNDRIEQLSYRVYESCANITGCNESCAILSLHGLFVRVVLFYHNRVKELCTWFICEKMCYSLITGCNLEVVLFYKYMVYLWELHYSIITGFICESCAILSLHGLFVRVVLFYHYRV